MRALTANDIEEQGPLGCREHSNEQESSGFGTRTPPENLALASRELVPKAVGAESKQQCHKQK